MESREIAECITDAMVLLFGYPRRIDIFYFNLHLNCIRRVAIKTSKGDLIGSQWADVFGSHPS